MSALFPFDERTAFALAERYGTPLFVYSQAAAESSYTKLRAALPQRARVAYAVKANPHAALLACFDRLGASFDCASIGELQRVEALRVDGERIFFAGPGKREAELALALQLGARIQAEGLEDLVRIEALSSGPVHVNLRVHPAFDTKEERRILGGNGPSAFGIDEEQLDEVLETARGLRHVRVRGLHVFAASNQRDARVLLDTHTRVFELARRLAEALGEPLEQIDLGGGLGIPYRPEHQPLDVVELGRGLTRLLVENPWFEGELLLEPGRFLAGTSGLYLARVVRTKASRGVHFAILEGGANHLLRPHLTGEPFPVRAQRSADPIPGPTQPYTLAGPLCTSLDRLGDVQLPALRAGDLINFGQCGAYGFTEGMTHFLSHPVPPEVWVAS
ncbi:MAG: pyridoxal-dependent decarboxylase, exosortase A system-associated [Planctomycetaceae bacterium]|nr:pyridoxal-dependent decarboxylase, exosortase A system-associated [Planctomycetaceae bacterium]